MTKYELTDPSSDTQASPLLDTGRVMTPNIMELTLHVTTSNTSNKVPVSTDSNIAMLASSTHDTGRVMTSNTTKTVLHLSRPQPSTETMYTPKQDASTGKTTPTVLVEKLNIMSDTVILISNKPSTRPRVKPMRKLYKMSQDDVEWEKKLLIKGRPKSKLKKGKISDPKVKVSARFSLSSYGDNRWNRKYNYKCKVQLCNESFHNIKLWNKHHLKKHPKISFPCTTCGKTCLTPSSARVHQYTHKTTRLSCR